MFKKIMLCIDLSPASESLVGCVSEMKKLGLEEIVLAHVIYVANTPGLEVMLEDDARPFLERHKASLEAHGFKVTTEMPFGLPAHALAEIAEKQDVSMVVIGSHGHGIMGKAILGSVASKLLNLTRRPILLVRLAILEGGKCVTVCRSLFDNILFPTDFSATAERVLEYLGQIATETKSPVTLLHVDKEKQIDAERRQSLEESARFFAEAKKKRLESRGVSNVTVELTFGEPAQEIIDRSNKGVFSLIVMGSQGKGLVQEVLLGSVSNKVVREAGLPVLLIPAAT